jgi:hypothetical protein
MQDYGNQVITKSRSYLFHDYFLKFPADLFVISKIFKLVHF